MDDTTTLIFKRLDIVDSMAADVAVIKSQMPKLATKDHVDLKIAAHAALPSKPPRANGRMSGRAMGAVVAALIAVTGALGLLIQSLL